MSFFDKIKQGVSNVVPGGRDKVTASTTGGIGGGGGAMGFEDDMIISKPVIVFHASQIFFSFLAMCCFASVAAFQAKWGVGPSGLSGFAIFVSVFTLVLSAGLLAIPVLYERYDRLTRFARVLKEARVAFIFGGTGLVLNLLIAFIVTISAWTEAGCKNADNDPNAKKGDAFKKGLDGWCATKKAGAVFFWLAFASWAVHFGLLVWDWRKGRLGAPRDPPFQHPAEQDDADAESVYQPLPPVRHDEDEGPFMDTAQRYSGAPSTDYAGGYGGDNRDTAYSGTSGYGGGAAPSGYAASSPARGRQSIDAYGAFSDPAPSGFDAPAGEAGSRVSRTMQYADPYAAVRASVATSQPPSYSPYQGYR
ncbi:unnamed protein product [Peniophora sp. CBMAI 1063]|nr:unnamed protein product [Peniophora sp. CBMAI 1063]